VGELVSRFLFLVGWDAVERRGQERRRDRSSWVDTFSTRREFSTSRSERMARPAFDVFVTDD
jgi:hypothetical protein